MKLGTKIRTKVRDEDTGPRGGRRIIKIGTEGVISGFDGELHDIVWSNGAWTRWTAEELARGADIVEEAQ